VLPTVRKVTQLSRSTSRYLTLAPQRMNRGPAPWTRHLRRVTSATP